MVHGDGAVGGQQGQDGLMEDQDGQEDQDTCTQGPGSGRGGCSAACWEFLPDRMKQKEAGLRKKATPLFSAMAMQMEPIAIMVRLRSARMAAAKFRAAGEKHPSSCSAESQIQHNFNHTASVTIKAIAMATRRQLPVNGRKLEPGGGRRGRADH